MTHRIYFRVTDDQSSGTSRRMRMETIRCKAISLGIQLRSENLQNYILVHAESDDEKAMFQFALWLPEEKFSYVETEELRASE